MEKQTSTPKTKAPEDAATVGMYLRYSRLNQKKTIDQAAKALCIRKIYIKAIEESNFKELPPVPYGMGFVRSYAKYLGLNAERIVQCYKNEAFPKKVAEKSLAPLTPARLAKLKPSRKQILFGLAAALLLCFIWLWASDNKPQPVLEEEPVAQDILPLEEEVVVESPAEIPAEQAIPEQPQPRVLIKLKGESWLGVRDKHKVYLTGTYPEGFEFAVPEGEGMRLSVGKRLNVEVYIDGVLTPVVRAGRQVNILLDNFLNH